MKKHCFIILIMSIICTTNYAMNIQKLKHPEPKCFPENDTKIFKNSLNNTIYPKISKNKGTKIFYGASNSSETKEKFLVAPFPQEFEIYTRKNKETSRVRYRYPFRGYRFSTSNVIQFHLLPNSSIFILSNSYNQTISRYYINKPSNQEPITKKISICPTDFNLIYNPSGTLLASVRAYKNKSIIELISSKDLSREKKITIPNVTICAIAFSYDEKEIAAADVDGMLYRINLSDVSLNATHPFATNGIAIKTAYQKMRKTSSSLDDTWRTPFSTRRPVCLTYDQTSTRIAISYPHENIRDVIRIIDLENPQHPSLCFKTNGYVYDIFFSQNNRYLCYTIGHLYVQHLRIFDTETNHIDTIYEIPDFQHVTFSNNKRRMLTTNFLLNEQTIYTLPKKFRPKHYK